MRLRYIKEASDIVLASPYVIKDPAARRDHWKFDPARPLYIEIGMGKGRFLIDTARAHPEADYIGIERYDSVLFRACERMAGIPYHTPADKLEREQNPELDLDFTPPENIRFLSADARALTEFFAKGEVDGIYLNFSDPWPKARHAKRRLTSKEFLHLYEQVLPDGGFIEFKTDNAGLFAFSKEEIAAQPHWQITLCTEDLHRDPVLMKDNIMTEYERKFSKLGNRICKLRAIYHETPDQQKEEKHETP